MMDEPYRWMEAIGNRREYIEHQIAKGSPIVVLSYRDGVLLFTLSRERQKLFEIHDRIAMGGIGHPGDLERLRMAAIELTSAEGFTRSAQDVSLRGLATFSLSPVLKAAFEQIYGPPYLARLVLAELGRHGAPNYFLRLDYDGAMHTNGGSFGRTWEDWSVISGSVAASRQMEQFLQEQARPDQDLDGALRVAFRAWNIGHRLQSEDGGSDEERPADDVLDRHAGEQLAAAAVEAAVLEHGSPVAATWRSLDEGEVRARLEVRSIQ